MEYNRQWILVQVQIRIRGGRHTMKQDNQVQLRIPIKLKKDSDKVFKKLNITRSEAVRSFLEYVVQHGELPY